MNLLIVKFLGIKDRDGKRKNKNEGIETFESIVTAKSDLDEN